MTTAEPLVTGVDFVSVPTDDFEASAGNPLDLHHRYAPPKPGGGAG